MIFFSEADVNYKMMGKFLSQILMVEIVFMIPALLISIFDGEYPAVTGFVVTILITAVISLASLHYFMSCAEILRIAFLHGRDLSVWESAGLQSVSLAVFLFGFPVKSRTL